MYNKRELSSHKGELSPEIRMYNIYNVWQPSLVLGGLGRALTVPIACEGSILGLALQAYYGTIITVHSLEVSTRKRT